MVRLEDVLRAKVELSGRLLPASLKAGVVHRALTLNAVAAAQNSSANVHAVGVGRKVVKGKPIRTWAVRLHVVQKLPESLLPLGARLPGAVDGLPTDIVESPPAFFAARRSSPRRGTRRRPVERPVAAAAGCTDERRHQQRPVIAGISAAHRVVGAGTIAYFCRSRRDTDDEKTVYALSNSHVFADVNRAQLGDEAYQPAILDGGTAGDRFATYGRNVPLALDGATANVVDAAIVALGADVAHTVTICQIGRIVGTEGATAGKRVRKHGRTTGYTEGEITDISYDALIGIDPRDPTVNALFQGQIRIGRVTSYPEFALLGDSGALVVSSERLKAIGLFFACPTNGAYGVANPITEVLDRLEISLL